MNKEQLREMLTVLYEVMGEERFAESVATMLWNIYTKAKGKGFTEEQAMALTLSFTKHQSFGK